MMLKVVVILLVHTVAIECGGPYFCVENGTKYPEGGCVPRGPLDNCTCQLTSRIEVICTDTKCDPVSCPNAIRPAGKCCEICPAVDCGDPGSIINGSVEFSSTTTGSVATFSCNKDYVLVGENTRTCQPNGFWSLKVPTCKAVQCPDIILEDWYADRATVEITSLSPGGKATITCNPGFYLNSPPKYATMTCLSDGYWDVDNLDCEKACVRDGQMYKRGDSIPYSNSCFGHCACEYGGKMDCWKECIHPVCLDGVQPIQMEGNCCPTCPPDFPQVPKNNTVKGCIALDGTIIGLGWDMPSPDDCFSCMCQSEGMICQMRCTIPECLGGVEPVQIKGNCCPTCPPVCTENGVTFQQGQSVPRGSCDICTCESSSGGTQASVVCTTIECDPVTCDNAILLPGQCCGVCPAVCTENRITYQQGQNVPRGQCDICTCESSLGGTQASVVCAVIDCVPVTCNNAFVPPGQCCAICPAVCTENGITYQSGETIPNQNPCLNCVCDNGQVTCSGPMCGDLRCIGGIQPETLVGNCCPTCPSVCVYNLRIYREGERIPDRNPCNICLCERGEVSCRPVICPTRPDCDGRYRPLGQCCLVCPKDSNGNDDPNENDDLNRINGANSNTDRNRNNGANGNNDRNRNNGANDNTDRNRNNGANGNDDLNRNNGAKSNNDLNRNNIANWKNDAHYNIYANRRQGRH